MTIYGDGYRRRKKKKKKKKLLRVVINNKKKTKYDSIRLIIHMMFLFSSVKG